MTTVTKAAATKERTICAKHVMPSNGAESFFCGRLAGHDDGCSKFPEVERQGIAVPLDLELLRKQIGEISMQLAALHDREAELEKDILVQCLGWTVGFGGKGCGARHRVGDLEYIQTHWYTQPSGCCEGDYWNSGEGQFICPSCGALNRLYERPAVEVLKHSFASVKDTYER